MEREGRFFGTMEELSNDVLRYNARLDDNILLQAVKPHMRMQFGDDRISWHLIEKYEDVWKVSGMEFSQVTLDVSLYQEATQTRFLDIVHYIMSRVRSPWRHK